MSLTLPPSGFVRDLRIPDRLRLLPVTVAAIARALSNRRRALQVADLPDHLLADIGLKRDDVHAALTADWRQDPTYRLARSARDNRCKR